MQEIDNNKSRLLKKGNIEELENFERIVQFFELMKNNYKIKRSWFHHYRFNGDNYNLIFDIDVLNFEESELRLSISYSAHENVSSVIVYSIGTYITYKANSMINIIPELIYVINDCK